MTSHAQGQEIVQYQVPGKKRKIFSYMEFDKKSREKPENLQPQAWKGKLRDFLHSKPLHFAVIALVLVDTALVITEILADYHVIGIKEESTAAKIIHYCSIGILSLFMVEIGLKLMADWRHFWSYKWEIVDAVVVVVAFGFDVGLLFIENKIAVTAGFLIVLRMWRIARIINGMVLAATSEADDEANGAKDKLKVKEEEVIKLEEKVEQLEKEYKNLKDVLCENGINIEEKPRSDDEETEKIDVHFPNQYNNFTIDT